MIPFGAWLPDQPELGRPHLLQAVNVISGGDDYEPLRELAALSVAIGSAPRGAASMRDYNGTVHVYAGDEVSLQELQSDGSWLDMTRVSGGPYACALTSRWRFTVFGNTAIATNYDDVIQAADMSISAPYADLAGSPPRARHITTFGDFLFYGNTEDSPSEIGWSGINDPTFHTVGSNQCDRQILPAGGAVQGFAPLDALLVFQVSKIRRLVYVGPPIIMQIDVVEEEIGALEAASIIVYGRRIFFLAEQGFHVIEDGASAQAIGDQQVNAWFFADCNRAYLYRMSGAVDPERKAVIWNYASTSSVNGDPDRQIIYNYVTKRWSLGTIADVELVFGAMALGYTLEDLDALSASIDALEVPLDDPSLMGGLRRFGAFNRDGAYCVFAGQNAEATLETGDFEILKGRRVYVSGVRPVIDGDEIEVSIGARERPMDAVAYTSVGTLEGHGMVSLEASGRYVRAKTVIAAGDEWTSALGLDFEAQPDGEI